MCLCLLLAVAFVALADGHSVTGLKGHRNRRTVVELTEEQKNILVDKHNELRRLVGASDMEKMVSITTLLGSMIHIVLISPNVNSLSPCRTSIYNIAHWQIVPGSIHLFLHNIIYIRTFKEDVCDRSYFLIFGRHIMCLCELPLLSFHLYSNHFPKFI